MTKGLTYILTGDGKGKTTAAVGLALRALGQQKKVLIIQFVKSPDSNSGEIRFIKNNLPQIDLHVFGAGFVGILNDKKDFSTHKKAAKKALVLAQTKILSGIFDVVILDEINGAIAGKLIDYKSVIKIIKLKPSHTHLVLTGRNAHSEIINLADMVSEIKNIKHPFDKKILPQPGIDY